MKNSKFVSLHALRRALLATVTALSLCSAVTLPVAADDTQAAMILGVPSQGGAGAAPVLSDPNYKLGSGDQVRVIVFGQPDLSGVFRVDGNGNVALPLIGTVNAGGHSVSQFETTVVGALKPDYLQDPRVSVEVLSFRPFYIVGEVQKPGNYPYTDGMTVINAVAMAGGFTYRAKDDDFTINRAGSKTTEEEADQNTKVHPGDVITVPERWF